MTAYRVTLGTRSVPRPEVSRMAEQIVGRREELVALEEFLEAVPAGG